MTPVTRYGTNVPVVKQGDEPTELPESASEAGSVAYPCATRPLRADAQRNRTKILEAAEAVFASDGIGVPVDEIARVAGVGVGTLYRHYPTKEALYEAIVLHHFELLIEDTCAGLHSDDPTATLFSLLERVVDETLNKRDLAEALNASGTDLKARPSLKAAFGQLEAMWAELLGRAQALGTVRDDVQIQEIFALVGGVCTATERSGSSVDPRRLLAVVVDGLRPGSANS
ncbi:MAG: Transcriptional regulator, TetR family [Acidimicrobiaceae bacterium]|nr:Transcriptional regulator, TetR family [Acidimicrobiaceae bacterium]